jgi:hypothetical protein
VKHPPLQTPPAAAIAAVQDQGSRSAPKTHNYGTEEEQARTLSGQRSALKKRRRRRQGALNRPPSGAVDGM